MELSASERLGHPKDSGRHNKASEPSSKGIERDYHLVQRLESRATSAAWTYLSLKWAVIGVPPTTVSVTSQQVFPMLGVFQL